jgi:hypothetical protein
MTWTVQSARLPVVLERADPHRGLLGERVRPDVPLEAELVERVACVDEAPWRLEQHEVHNLLAVAAGVGGAADVLDSGVRHPAAAQ